MKLMQLGEVSHFSTRKGKKGGRLTFIACIHVPGIGLGNLSTLCFFILSITLNDGIISVLQVMQLRLKGVKG